MNIENLRQKVAIVANNSILRSNRVKNCVHVWMWMKVVLVENEEKRRHLANIRVQGIEKYRCSIFSMLKKRDDDSLLVGSTICIFWLPVLPVRFRCGCQREHLIKLRMLSYITHYFLKTHILCHPFIRLHFHWTRKGWHFVSISISHSNV